MLRQNRTDRDAKALAEATESYASDRFIERSKGEGKAVLLAKLDESLWQFEEGRFDGD
jgi:hypothetical protein